MAEMRSEDKPEMEKEKEGARFWVDAPRFTAESPIALIP